MPHPSDPLPHRPNLQTIEHFEQLPLFHWPYVRLCTGKCLQYGSLLLFIFRSLYLCWHVKAGGSPFDHLRYNPVMTNFMVKFRFVDYHTGSLICLLLPFAVYIDYSCFFRLNYDQAKLLHELLVDNAEDLMVLNRQKLQLKNSKHLASTLKREITLLKCIWNYPKLRFKHRHLSGLPYLSTKLRARVVVFSRLIEWNIAVINIVWALTVATFALTFLHMISPEVSWPTFSIALLDWAILAYAAWNTVRVALFGEQIYLLFGFISNGHITSLNDSLRVVLHSSSQSITAKGRHLQFFYLEHTRLKQLAVCFDRGVTSRAVFVSFLSNIPLNVTMISRLVFRQHYRSEQLLMSFIAFFQIFLNIAAALIFVYWSSSLYRSTCLLYRGQLLLTDTSQATSDKRCTLFKLKLLFFCESLAMRRQFRFTIGPVAKISHRSIVKFLIAYSGLFMYISKSLVKRPGCY